MLLYPVHAPFPCSHSTTGCKTELQMMYAGSKLGLVGEGGFTKVRILYYYVRMYVHVVLST